MNEKITSIQIINETGVSNDTKVFNHEGQPLRGITRIEIHPLTIDNFVRATVTFECVELAIAASWEIHPLKQWANRKAGK